MNFLTSLNQLEMLKIIVSKKNKITSEELMNSKTCKKINCCKTKIKKGEKFSRKNITTKRPNNGISADKWFEVLNKVAKKNFEANELIKL